MVLIKYIKEAKYDTLLFIPIDITDAEYIKTKNYNGNKYIFLKKKRVKSKDNLKNGYLYTVTTKSWVHNKVVYVLYYLKPKVSNPKIDTCDSFGSKTEVLKPNIKNMKPITEYFKRKVKKKKKKKKNKKIDFFTYITKPPQPHGL